MGVQLCSPFFLRRVRGAQHLVHSPDQPVGVRKHVVVELASLRIRHFA